MQQYIQDPTSCKIHWIKQPLLSFGAPTNNPLYLPPTYKWLSCSTHSYIVARSSWKDYQLFYLQFIQDYPEPHTQNTFSNFVIKSRISIQCQYYDILTMNDKQAIIWYAKVKEHNGSFLVWHLQDNKVTKLQSQHMYTRKYNNQIKLFCFQSTQIFCFCQKFMQKNGLSMVVKLTYYRVIKRMAGVGLYISLQIIKRFQHSFSQQQTQKYIQILQINNSSKIGLMIKYSNQLTTQFKIYDLNLDNYQDNLTSFVFEHKIIQQLPICDVILTELWQISAFTFYMKFQTQLNQEKYFQLGAPNLQGKYRHFHKQFQYIWNYKFGSVRKPTYTINNEYYQVQFANCLRSLKRFKTIPIKNPLPLKQVYGFEDYVPFQAKMQFIVLPLYLIYLTGYQQRLGCRIQFSQQETKNVYLNNKVVYNQVYVSGNSAWKILRYFIRRQPLKRSLAIAFIINSLINDCDDCLLYDIIELVNKQ